MTGDARLKKMRQAYGKKRRRPWNAPQKKADNMRPKRCIPTMARSRGHLLCPKRCTLRSSAAASPRIVSSSDHLELPVTSKTASTRHFIQRTSPLSAPGMRRA
ncbi:hypothetical protein MTO96_051867 [Rhipicephalus appendiculatus]